MRPRHQLSSLQTETSAKKQCRDQDINQGTIQRPRNKPRNSPRHQVFNIETRTSGISQGTVLRQRHLPRNCLRDQAISQGTVQRPSNQPRNSLETETQAKKKKKKSVETGQEKRRDQDMYQHGPTRDRHGRNVTLATQTSRDLSACPSGSHCLQVIELLAFPLGRKHGDERRARRVCD